MRRMKTYYKRRLHEQCVAAASFPVFAEIAVSVLKSPALEFGRAQRYVHGMFVAHAVFIDSVLSKYPPGITKPTRSPGPSVLEKEDT